MRTHLWWVMPPEVTAVTDPLRPRTSRVELEPTPQHWSEPVSCESDHPTLQVLEVIISPNIGQHLALL